MEDLSCIAGAISEDEWRVIKSTHQQLINLRLWVRHYSNREPVGMMIISRYRALPRRKGCSVKDMVWKLTGSLTGRDGLMWHGYVTLGKHGGTLRLLAYL